ncbi:hypothetical protein BH09GEM1_BH09GEM1_29670 [soil metagenome]
MPVIVLVADGARLDAFQGALADLPALRRLRDEGGLHPVSTVAPSVTGPAYTPFMTGRFPGPIGVPGIRWYDRARLACGWPGYSRSYVGIQFRQFDDDLDPSVPTIFEMVPNSLAALSVITRGLPHARRLGTLTVRSAARVALTHFRGKAEAWLDVDREVMREIPRRVREERPDYLFAAFAGVDKASHAFGHESALAHEALGIVDATAARLRSDAEAGGWWDDTHLFVVSDHGHSAVDEHEDLVRVIADTGLRVMSHPWVLGLPSDVAAMVSGNAMAQLYLEPSRRARPWWPALASRWDRLAAVLLKRESVDLLLLPHSPTLCEIRSAHRGTALVGRDGDSFFYRRTTGDPLGCGSDVRGSADATHDVMSATDYPDAIVQVVSLAGSSRAGDLILSARPGWDLRARYEPIPHCSAHGALHRDHMIVPLLMNRRPARAPRRTTDVFASALAALGVAAPLLMDGASFL